MSSLEYHLPQKNFVIEYHKIPFAVGTSKRVLKWLPDLGSNQGPND